MNKQDYFLELIIHIFEKLQTVQEPTVEIKRKEFQEKILKKQSELYINGHFTKKEFRNECDIAIEYLRNYVRKGIDSEKYKETKGKTLFTILGGAIKSTQTTNTPNTLPVSITTYSGNTTRIKLCLNDINFIESAFEAIYFSEPEHTKNIDSIDDLTVEGKKIKKHNEIFNANGFLLFDYILHNFIRNEGERGRYEDLSFFYWKMYNDKYIHQKPVPFKDWFIINFNNEKIFTKIKTLEQVRTPQREKNYSISKDSLKQELKKSTISDF